MSDDYPYLPGCPAPNFSGNNSHSVSHRPAERKRTGDFFVNSDLTLQTLQIPESEYDRRRRESITFALAWLNRNVLSRREAGHHLKRRINSGVKFDDETHRYLINSCLHWKGVVDKEQGAGGRPAPATCPDRMSYTGVSPIPSGYPQSGSPSPIPHRPATYSASTYGRPSISPYSPPYPAPYAPGYPVPSPIAANTGDSYPTPATGQTRLPRRIKRGERRIEREERGERRIEREEREERRIEREEREERRIEREEIHEARPRPIETQKSKVSHNLHNRSRTDHSRSNHSRSNRNQSSETFVSKVVPIRPIIPPETEIYRSESNSHNHYQGQSSERKPRSYWPPSNQERKWRDR